MSGTIGNPFAFRRIPSGFTTLNDCMAIEAGSKTTQVVPAELRYLGDANYVQAPGVPETFLISEYPSSPEDYWQAMILSKAQVGIQLHQKGVNYHPPLGYIASFGGGTVRLLRQLILDDQLIQREYLIRDDEGITRRFTHYSLFWEDYTVPKSDSFAELMLAYHRRIEQLGPSPVVHVHCRAGLGRSGTFVFARCLDSQKKTGNQMPPEDLLKHLRSQRRKLVENYQQFSFACECVNGFDYYGKLSQIESLNLQGRISWIRMDGQLEVMPLWKHLLVLLAALINCHKWMMRKLVDVQASINGMIELRKKIIDLAHTNPTLLRKYWSCWEIFKQTFEVSSGEVRFLLDTQNEPKHPSLDLVRSSRCIRDIEGLLELYSEPAKIVEQYVLLGMLGHALWVIRRCSVDITEIKTSIDKKAYDWLELQLNIMESESSSSCKVSSKLNLEKHTREVTRASGQGGESGDNQVINSQPKEKMEIDPSPKEIFISDFELSYYLKTIVPGLKDQWANIVQAASNGNLEAAGIFGLFDDLREEVRQALTKYPFVTPTLEQWLRKRPNPMVGISSFSMLDGDKRRVEPDFDKCILVNPTSQNVSNAILDAIMNGYFQELKCFLNLMEMDQEMMVVSKDYKDKLSLPAISIWLELMDE